MHGGYQGKLGATGKILPSCQKTPNPNAPTQSIPPQPEAVHPRLSTPTLCNAPKQESQGNLML